MKIIIFLISCLFVLPSFAEEKILKGMKFANFVTDKPVPTKDVIHFGCRNILNNIYLVNKAGTKICWIENPKDHKAIMKRLKLGYFREQTVAAEECPEKFTTVPFCNSKNLRKF